MKTLSEHHSKKNIIQVLLAIVLIAFTILTTYMVVNGGEKNGILVIGVIIACAVVVCALANPYLGFCIAIFISFFAFSLERYTMTKGSGALVESVMYISFLGILIHKFISREQAWNKKWHPVSILFLLYFVFICFEMVNPNAHSMPGNLVYLRELLKQLMTYFIALNLFTSYKKIRSFLFYWCILMIICGLYGCFQQWFGLAKFEKSWLNSFDILVKLYRLSNGDFRKFSTLSDPVSFGVTCSATGLFFLVFMFYSKSSIKKAIFFFAFIIMALGMAYSGTRTATFILIAGVVLYLVVTIDNKRTIIFAVVSALLFSFLLFAPIYSNTTLNRFRSTFEPEDASLNVRDFNRGRVQPYLHQHPFGGGLSTAGVNGVVYNPNHYLTNFPPDSGLLKFTMETGWIGLAFIGIIYCIVLQTAVKGYFDTVSEFSKKYLLALLLSLFAFIVAQYSQVAIGQIPGIFIFYGGAAAIVRITQFDKENIKQTT